MTKPIEDFYEKAWEFVQRIQNDAEDFEFLTEIESMLPVLKKVPDKGNHVSLLDLNSFFVSLGLVTDSSTVWTISKEELIDEINKNLFSDSQKYSVYFRIKSNETNFPHGFTLGKGKFEKFEDLPKQVQESILKNMKKNYQKEGTPNQTFEEYEKERKSDSFLSIETDSIGKYKAIDNSTIEAKRASNILKIIYPQTPSPKLRTKTPFDLYAYSEKDDSVEYIPEDNFPSMLFYYNFSMEDFLKNINVIIQKDNPNELEQRILNAIDVYGLSDDNTPLHVKFLLCVICLEGLLLSSSDKDYLGWKLSEKITMLLGDTKQWCLHLYAYEDPYLTREKYEEFAKNLTDKYVEDHLVESREKLFKKITTIYGKRSSFAHSVLKSKRKEQDSISEEDYLYAFLILRWIIELFLRLSENGISHIGKMKEEDEASLDVYLQRMKYRQKNTITGDI